MGYLRRNKDHIPVHLYFIAVSAWWVFLKLTRSNDDTIFTTFGAVYALFTIYGGLLGLYYSKKWGFLKSYLGKALFFFSMSLFLTELGQLTFSYYNIFADIEAPYPSLADIGFFGAIPMYIFGTYYLSKTLNVKNPFKGLNLKSLLWALLPLFMVGSTALLYQHYYDAYDSSKLVVFLDYGYPIGQAITATLALITLLKSRRALGGIMRPRILLLLVAIFLQYAADFNFLIQSFQESWISGQYGDYLYFLAYYILILALLSFKTIVPEQRPKNV